MADNENSKAVLTPEELRQKRISNLKPFRKPEELTPEELKRQRELQTKGSFERAKSIAKKNSMKEDALRLLNTLVRRDDAVTLIGDSAKYFEDNELTFQNILMVSAFKEAQENGNVKAMEFLRDTAGYKPKDEVSVEADIMTDADRALIDRMSKRLTLKSDERIG